MLDLDEDELLDDEGVVEEDLPLQTFTNHNDACQVVF